MQGKVHVAIGVASTVCLCAKYPTGFEFANTMIIPLIALATATAGSYAPDIDMGRTHSGMKHKTASKVISKVGGGHRGITHTLLVPAIVAALMFLVSNYLTRLPYIASVLNSLLFGFQWGYIMHLFADLFNGKGIPLFWPIMRGKVHIADLPSSGFGGWAFAVVMIFIMGAFTFGGLFG